MRRRAEDQPAVIRVAHEILTVEEHWRDPRIFEVHPELWSAATAGAPLVSKNWNGAMRRRTLLAAHGIELRDDLAAAGPVPVDDVLDAAAVAWTAGRIAADVALCLPTGPTPAGRSPPSRISLCVSVRTLRCRR